MMGIRCDRRPLAALIVLLAASLLCGFQALPSGSSVTPPSGWQLVIPPGQGYCVLMPAGSTYKDERQQDSSVGEHRNRLVVGRYNDCLYISGCTEYKPDLELNVEGELKANMDNFLNGVGAKALSSKRQQHQGKEALAFTAESESHAFRSLVVLTEKNRVLMIVAAHPKGTPEPSEFGAFFRSFLLLR
jgi:hypothetical protein